LCVSVIVAVKTVVVLELLEKPPLTTVGIAIGYLQVISNLGG
jgi:hypothetical protein